MSSPFTATILGELRELNASRRGLAKIVFSVPSALTIRYATNECITPDGALWQTGLTIDPIRESVGYMGPGVSPVETTIRLAKRRDASQAAGETLHDMLSTYLWQNAQVTLYLWCSDSAEAPEQVFGGVVSRPVNVDADGMTLHLLQDMSWNKITPPTVVDKTNYPDSPDVSQGLPIPIVYGDHIAPPMRSPWASSYGAKQYQEDSGAGGGVVPGVLVDSGVGAASVKVVFAGHECADILARASGYSQFIVGNNTLDPLDTTGITETLGASESYIAVADENAIAYSAVIPIDVRSSAGGNTAGDPRRAMDPFDETTYATLDQTAGKNELQLILPNIGLLGRIESVMAYVAFSGDAGNGNNMRVNTYTPGVGAGGSAPASWVATSTTPGISAVVWPTAYWTQDWDFGGSSTVLDIRVDFTGGTTNKARIYWVALVVKYRPQRSVVTPGKTYVTGKTAKTWGPFSTPSAPDVGVGTFDPTRWFYKNVFSTIASTYKLESQFFANIKGQPDDGSGTYTGTAAALIQRPPDIARHFLVNYGGVTGSDIETGSSTTGSFVDARSTLRNAQVNDLKMACWIGDRTSVQRVLQTIAEQSGMCIYLDRFTNKWLCFVWKKGASADYDRTLSWDYGDFAAFQCEETSVVDVRHAIRVKYGFDHFKNKTLYEAFITADSSGQGIHLQTTRDQRLTVESGVNDDVDFKIGASTYACVLAAGTYAPIDLADEARTKARTAVGNNNVECGYGFSIKTGFNNIIDFTVGGTPYAATMNEADYTAEGFAVEVARAMNAAGSGLTFTCTYDHSTNKFTVSGSSAFALDPSPTAANYATSAVHVLGQVNTYAAATSKTMETSRYGDRFWWGYGDAASGVNMLWGSGTSASTNAAYLMGYERTDSGSTRDNPATYARGDRERTADTFQGYYGPREERQLTADWVRDETTAVELRNRHFDLTAKPRVVVRFSSFRVPDIRRMQVFQISSDLDKRVAFPKYGSDGSWAGKTFRVLEVEQNMGPSFHTEVLAIEAD